MTVDPEMGARVSLLDAVVQVRVRKPDTTLTVVAPGNDQAQAYAGRTPDGTPKADVVLTMDADVAHALWIGKQNVAIGIARGSVQTKGDTRKIVDLLNLTGEIAPRYEALLRAAGRQDLIDADPFAPAADAAPAADDAPAEDEAVPPAQDDADAAQAAEPAPAGDGEGADPAAEGTAAEGPDAAEGTDPDITPTEAPEEPTA
nr:SCP2 sterol-binding domain-containing protein [Patulibacter sp. SYSU D01012]